MVGPVPNEERVAMVRKIQAAFVLLVGGSGGLMALQGDVGATGVGLAIVLGLAVGAGLAWLVFPSSLDYRD